MAALALHNHTTTSTRTMTYEESFLSTCDAEGNAPDWAINQIMQEHGSSLILMSQHVAKDKWFNGETILEWLGY